MNPALRRLAARSTWRTWSPWQWWQRCNATAMVPFASAVPPRLTLPARFRSYPSMRPHSAVFVCCLKKQSKRNFTQLQFVVTGLSQVCKLTYNSGVQKAKYMCACCLANFLLHEPYHACQGPACQAWRHTHMLERRAKQALQPQHCTMPAGFWGMPPQAPPPNK